MHPTNCLNCGHPLQDDGKFCSQCGQKADTHRLSIGHFAHETFHAFTHTDKSIFHLLVGLAMKPGVVAREYIVGKRKKYFNPYTFFILLMGAYLLTAQLFGRVDEPRPVPEAIQRIPDPAVREKASARFDRGQKIGHFYSKHANVLAMVAIPMIAFVFWLFYIRRPYNYAEHLTANMMFVTFANLVFALTVFPLQNLLKGTAWGPWITLVGLLIQVTYFSWAYSQFLQVRTAGGRTKTFFVSLLSVFVWSVFSLVVMAIYVYQSWDFYKFFGQMGRR